MRLSQNEVEAQKRNSAIRTVQLPRTDCYYYSKQNLLARLNSQQFIEIFFIHVNKVEMNKDLTCFLKNEFGRPDQVLFIENNLIICQHNKIFKINIDDYDKCEIFLRTLPQDIIKYNQINEKNLMILTKQDYRLRVYPLRIYQLRNFKKSHTLINKRQILTTQYNKLIVQACSHCYSYYYNTNMNKQIRKYEKYYKDEPIFYSNYLIMPIIWFYETKLNYIVIYDFYNMKRKGAINLTQMSQLEYESCIYIKDYNVIGILYKTRLYLYDFQTLKCINSLQIDGQLNTELYMKFDEYNGLTIFIR